VSGGWGGGTRRVDAHITPATSHHKPPFLPLYPPPPFAGHFPNEDLHALFVLDAALPLSIPLLWPVQGISAHFLDELRAEGLLHPDRKLVRIGPRHVRSHLRARRLYFFRTNRAWGQSPFISWYGHRFVQQQLLPVLARKTGVASPADAARRVVVLQRHGARSLTNHMELMGRLAQLLPGAEIESFVPGPGEGHPMWDGAQRIYKSCLLIGPHGGNMPNELFQLPGCWVIEIGFVDQGFPVPTDFYCFARNLGLNYWLSVGDGGYASALTADMADIEEIVMQYKREVFDAAGE
jgi:hypothetical protein